jgi:F-type H+-transporting ATPase subunit b
MLRNWAIVFVLSSLIAALGLAQETHPTPATPPAAEAHGANTGAAEHHAPEGDPYIVWKWVNFGLLAIGLGYLISKNLPPFFAARNEEIRKGIEDAAKLKAEADVRAADMEKRMARLGAEIEEMRAHTKSEMAAEGERIRKETEEILAKVQSNATLEIESAAKNARHELKAYSANLALQLAEERIRTRAGAGSESVLVEKFIRGLEGKGVNN